MSLAFALSHYPSLRPSGCLVSRQCRLLSSTRSDPCPARPTHGNGQKRTPGPPPLFCPRLWPWIQSGAELEKGYKQQVRESDHHRTCLISDKSLPSCRHPQEVLTIDVDPHRQIIPWRVSEVTSAFRIRLIILPCRNPFCPPVYPPPA